jgi:hypothetical protein
MSSKKSMVSAETINLDKQLNIFCEGLGSFAPDEINYKKILDIIHRNNEIADLLITPQFGRIINFGKRLRGDAKVGFVYCFDGRIWDMLWGRLNNVWRAPGGILYTAEGPFSGKLRPASDNLIEALRASVDPNRDLLEVCLAHTALTTKHGCGYMRMKYGSEISEEDLVQINLDLIRQNTIPAITNSYNEAMEIRKLSPLERVAVEGIFETDAVGLIFGDLSTTEIVKNFEGQLNVLFGSMQKNIGDFTDHKNLINFSKRLMDATAIVLTDNNLGINKIINGHIEKIFGNLTDMQKQALRFFIARIVCFQYLTGVYQFEGHPTHPFSKHGEAYVSIATSGKNVGDNDTRVQTFGCTPADAIIANEQLEIELMVLESNRDKTKPRQPVICFIPTLVDKYQLGKTPEDDSEALNNIRGENAHLYRYLMSTQSKRVKERELIFIPCGIDRHTRGVLRIFNHSTHV